MGLAVPPRGRLPPRSGAAAPGGGGDGAAGRSRGISRRRAAHAGGIAQICAGMKLGGSVLSGKRGRWASIAQFPSP